MNKDNFKRMEYTLYNYRNLEIKIKNIEIDINNLENDITIKAISYEERTGATNAFNSTVENEVIRRDEHVQEKISILKAKLKYNKDLKVKIDGALEGLTDTEKSLIELRYFSREKKKWAEIGMKLGFDMDYCVKLKNRVINKLSELIYP